MIATIWPEIGEEKLSTAWGRVSRPHAVFNKGTNSTQKRPYRRVGTDHDDDSDTLAVNRSVRPERTRSYLLSAGLRWAGSSRISKRAVAQYTRSRFASPTRFTIRARSSRSMARCAVVNAIANFSATPFVVMNGCSESVRALSEDRKEDSCGDALLELAAIQLQACSVVVGKRFVLLS